MEKTLIEVNWLTKEIKIRDLPELELKNQLKEKERDLILKCQDLGFDELKTKRAVDLLIYNMNYKLFAEKYNLSINTIGKIKLRLKEKLGV